jgi:hypothetical protein
MLRRSSFHASSLFLCDKSHTVLRQSDSRIFTSTFIWMYRRPLPQRGVAILAASSPEPAGSFMTIIASARIR